MKPLSIKSNRTALGFLIFLNFLFWYFGFTGGHIYLKDSFEYIHQAENLKSGNYWYSGDVSQPFNKDQISQRPPLYGFSLMIAKSIIANDHITLFLQCLFGAFVFYSILFLLKEMKVRIEYPILLFIPLLFFPTQMIYANMIMSELLCQIMITLSFFFLVMFLLNYKTKHLLFFHVFISLAILTKPVWYLFWIPSLLLMSFLFWNNKIRIYHSLFLLIPIATVLFICFYNFNQTGYFHYSSVKRTNMVNYNVYLTLTNKFNSTEAFHQIMDVRDSAETKASYKEYCQYIEAANTRIIIENLPMYLWLETKGILNFFIDHGRFDLYGFFSSPPEENMNGIPWYYRQKGIIGIKEYLSHFPIILIIYLPLICLVNVLITLCFILFLFDKKIPLEIRIAAFLFIFYLAFITGPIGAARFRMPIYPILLFSLPFGIGSLKRMIIRK